MRFESKRDAWLVVTMRLIPAVVLAVVAFAWYQEHHDVRGPIIGVFVLLAVEIFFFEWVFRSTYYVIEGDGLIIRSSFITWRVPIRAITAVTPTRSAISSPALSLDRLRIDYGGRAILVSPERKHAFVDALRAINPAIIRRE